MKHLTVADYLAEGYRGFPQSTKPGCINFLQKTIWGYGDQESTKLYFISVDVYAPILHLPVTCAPHVRFYMNGGCMVDVECHQPESVDKTEAFFADMFKRMEFEPDPHNN